MAASLAFPVARSPRPVCPRLVIGPDSAVHHGRAALRRRKSGRPGSLSEPKWWPTPFRTSQLPYTLIRTTHGTALLRGEPMTIAVPTTLQVRAAAEHLGLPMDEAYAAEI